MGTQNPSPISFGQNHSNSQQKGILSPDGTLIQNDGPKNIVPNATFENGTVTGWYTGVTGTLTNGIPTGTPTFGSGSAGTLSFAASSTSPIDGAYHGLLTSTAASTAGNMIHTDPLTLSPAYQGRLLTVSNMISVLTGATNLNLSGTLTNSIGVALYDVTNSAWLQPPTPFIYTQSSGVQSPFTQIQTLTTTASVRVCLYFPNASAGAFSLGLKNFFLGIQPNSSGYVGTSWQTYTPIFTGFGTVPSSNIQTRRDGPDLVLRGTFTTGTPTGVTAQMSLGFNGSSGNVTIGTGISGTQAFGSAYRSGSATPVMTIISADGNTSINFSLTSTSSQSPTAAQTGTNLVGAGEVIAFDEVRIPIAGWTSGAQMSSDSSNRLVDFIGNNTATQSVTANTTDIAFLTVKDSTGAWTGTQYKVNEAGDYHADLTGYSHTGTTQVFSVYVNGSFVKYLFQSTSGAVTSAGTVVPNLKPNDLISFRCGTTDTLEIGIHCAIYKIQGPVTTLGTEQVSAIYTTLSSTSNTANASFKLTTKIKDTHSAYNTSTGIYTIPYTSQYKVTFVAPYCASAALNIRLYKGGTDVIGMPFGGATASPTISLSNSVSWPFNAGDQIYVGTEGTGSFATANGILCIEMVK